MSSTRRLRRTELSGRAAGGPSAVGQSVEAVFREEWGRLLATLETP